MRDHFVRLTKVEIQNFKNVRHGVLDVGQTVDNQASVLGVFGQNGSGKTALLDSIELLRYALTGQAIPEKFADFIYVGADTAQFEFDFVVKFPDVTYDVQYAFTLSKVILSNENNTNLGVSEEHYKALISEEVLKFRYTNGLESTKLSVLINTKGIKNSGEPFTPKVKYNELVGGRFGVQQVLLMKAMAAAMGKSFIFSAELLSVIRKNCTKLLYLDMIEALVQYGNFELFIINTANTGVISMNGLPFAFHLDEKGSRTRAVGQILVPINGPTVIPSAQFVVLQKIVQSMNLVLNVLVPGLSIAIKDLGQSLLGKTSVVGQRVELVSCKNSREIPLKYESEGIKKIISILQLLIEIYNKPSVTVVVDELDAGIFEYLLGEILAILVERGRGQLIFTSHNLRPLETLPPKCVVFTTTDPMNCYERMTCLKKTNNLRSCYYRNIILGNNNCSFYNETDNYKIAMAFRKAGINQANAAEENADGT